MLNNDHRVTVGDSELVEALSSAVLLLDAKLCILRANTAAQTLLALSTSKLIGARLAEVLPGADEVIAATRRALLEEREFSERGLDLRLLKQTQHLVDCSATPIWDGQPSAEYVVLELKSAEHHQHVQREDTMAMQNVASSALLQGLAHEIKNPLGGIRGAAQLLERELDDPRLAEYTQIIIGEADRLRTLVERMLGPRGALHKASVNIHDVLEHVRRVVEAERADGCAIACDYDPSLPELYADRDQLVQAFLNLVRNAVDATTTGGGGAVTLRTRVQRKFTLNSKTHRHVVLAQVIDTGVGVDEKLGSSIFFPLVSGRAAGTGLGLPIAQSLVQRHGGLIGFESEPGRTEFSVWLPLGEQA